MDPSQSIQLKNSPPKVSDLIEAFNKKIDESSKKQPLVSKTSIGNVTFLPSKSSASSKTTLTRVVQEVQLVSHQLDSAPVSSKSSIIPSKKRNEDCALLKEKLTELGAKESTKALQESLNDSLRALDGSMRELAYLATHLTQLNKLDEATNRLKHALNQLKELKAPQEETKSLDEINEILAKLKEGVKEQSLLADKVDHVYMETMSESSTLEESASTSSKSQETSNATSTTLIVSLEDYLAEEELQGSEDGVYLIRVRNEESEDNTITIPYQLQYLEEGEVKSIDIHFEKGYSVSIPIETGSLTENREFKGTSLDELVASFEKSLSFTPLFTEPEKNVQFAPSLQIEEPSVKLSTILVTKIVDYLAEEELEGSDDNVYLIREKMEEESDRASLPYQLHFMHEGEPKSAEISRSAEGYSVSLPVVSGSLTENEEFKGTSLEELVANFEKKLDFIPLYTEAEGKVQFAPSNPILSTTSPISKKESSSLSSFSAGLERIAHKWVQAIRSDQAIEGNPHLIIERSQELPTLIAARRKEILAEKTKWRSMINTRESSDSILQKAQTFLGTTPLTPIGGGLGGAYQIVDEQGQTQFVLKPSDEDLLCLNNRKQKATPWNDQDPLTRVREDIPLYETVQTEVLSSELAVLAGIPTATPKTTMMIVHSEAFHDIMDEVTRSEHPKDIALLAQSGSIDKEKLCSVQEFLSDATSLQSLQNEWSKSNATRDEIAKKVDQTAFEEANIFMWLTYDNDGHTGNFLAQERIDEQGDKKLFFVKIDNGMAFPDKNTRMNNQLVTLPNAKQPLSDEAKQKIAGIDVESAVARMKSLGKDGAIEAFRERVAILKELALRPKISIEEINLRMELIPSDTGLLSIPSLTGRELALSPLLSLNELKELINPTQVFKTGIWEKDDGEIAALGKYRLATMLKERRQELKDKEGLLKPAIEAQRDNTLLTPMVSHLGELQDTGHLEATSGGKGGAYFLKDAQGHSQFVLKPADEDFSAFNNRKGERTPWSGARGRVKEDIPLYRTCQAEALAWEIGVLAGIPDSTPKTVLLNFQSTQFHDITDEIDDKLPEPQKLEIREMVGARATTKLCSAQEFLEGAEELGDYLHKATQDWNDLSPEEATIRFNELVTELFTQQNIEDIQFLIWLTYDNDAHLGNFIMIQGAEEGSKTLKKIDNGLCFGNAHSEFRNEIDDWPHMELPISQNLREKILSIPIEEMMDKMVLLGMQEAIPAFQIRVGLLQELASNEGVTLKDINEAMKALEAP